MAITVSSARRQRIIEFSTPKVADLVVIEVVDASKNLKSAASADNTAFGTAHPDSNNFPNHKLAFIKSAEDENGQFQLWYYIIDRSDQDDYNWEYKTAGVCNSRYDTVVRTYITLRSSYDEADPAPNSAMPISTSDPFASGDNYVLFEKNQTRSGDNTLDTLYVVDQRVYVKKNPFRNIHIDDTFPYDVTPTNASVDSPGGGSATDPAYGALLEKETLFYKDETIKATTVFQLPGALTDDVDTEVATSGSVNAKTAFRDPDLQFASGISASGTTNFWGTDELGIKREGTQISENWYSLNERQVVPPVNTTSGAVTLANYTTNERYAFPAVLDPTPRGMFGGQNGVVGHTWRRKKGGGDTVVFPVYKREAYDGPCKHVREITWRKQKWTDSDLTDLNPMHPLPIHFVTPLNTTSVKPTLHGDMQLKIDTGSNHPVYHHTRATFTYWATNYTDWPEKLVILDTQKPFRGGYLREKVTVYPPELVKYTGTHHSDVYDL